MTFPLVRLVLRSASVLLLLVCAFIELARVAGTQRHVSLLTWESFSLTGYSKIYLWDSGRRVHMGSESGASNPTLSQDGQLAWLQYRAEDWTLYVWDREQTIKLDENMQAVTSVIWSRDGYLAWTLMGERNAEEIHVWNREQVLNLTPEASSNYSPTWSNDGRLVWVSTREGDSEIYIWDRQRVSNLSQNLGEDRLPSWSEDGRLAWASQGDGGYREIVVWDGDERIKVNSEIAYSVSTLHWSGIGQLTWIAESRGFLEIYVWDGRQTINLGRADPSSPPVWPGNGWLAWIWPPNNSLPEIYIWNKQEIMNLSPFTFGSSAPTWSEDGRLAWAGMSNGNSEIFVWDERQIMNLSQLPANDFDPIWSGDGRLSWISRRDRNEEIYVWDGVQTINVSQNLGVDSDAVWSWADLP